MIRIKQRITAVEILRRTKTLGPVLFRLFPMRNAIPNGSYNRTLAWDLLILPQLV